MILRQIVQPLILAVGLLAADASDAGAQAAIDVTPAERKTLSVALADLPRHTVTADDIRQAK